MITPVVNRTLHTYNNTLRILCEVFSRRDGREDHKGNEAFVAFFIKSICSSLKSITELPKCLLQFEAALAPFFELLCGQDGFELGDVAFAHSSQALDALLTGK